MSDSRDLQSICYRLKKEENSRIILRFYHSSRSLINKMPNQPNYGTLMITCSDSINIVDRNLKR